MEENLRQRVEVGQMKGKRAYADGGEVNTRERERAGKFHALQLLPPILYLVLCRTMWKRQYTV